ncbi:glycosyltransferase [Pseudidiomarina donghaiensis]|uniref:glycosyltransferase n=1 Tax=Pseudidiomarina donghaiensis TaxID=519452 RepID=UPI003A96ECDE
MDVRNSLKPSLSVLLSVYHKEQVTYLEQALCSVWDNQTLKPAQIVLVQDGPLTAELNAAIAEWQDKLGAILTIVPLEQNVGLGAALNIGLQHCEHELVARMDTDDIAMPNRFEKQFTFMQNNPEVVACSGLIEEWSQDYSYKISERHLPLTHQEIAKFAKYRSPISHPAVIFRKSAVLAVGGYPNIYPEDYPLWGKMLSQGYKFANLPDLLLKMRIGNALTERRGLEFLKGEIKIYRYLCDIGFINQFEFLFNCISRGLVRLSPAWLKKIFYKYLR